MVNSMDDSQMVNDCMKEKEEEYEEACWQIQNKFVELYTKCERQVVEVAWRRPTLRGTVSISKEGETVRVCRTHGWRK